MRIVAAALAGLLFGFGLTLSGMVNPAIVLGFLDIAGHWNPTLLFVMAGALAVAIPGTWLLGDRKPVFADRQMVSGRRDIDAVLVTGSAIFGLGWGLAGVCPGPALAMFAIRPGMAVLFVVAMTLGMLASRFVMRWIPGAG